MRSLFLSVLMSVLFFAGYGQQYVPMPTNDAVWSYRGYVAYRFKVYTPDVQFTDDNRRGYYDK